MTPITYRIVEQFPEPAFSALSAQAFADYEPSALLATVLDEEVAARPAVQTTADVGALRIGAFRGDELVGWSYGRPDGAAVFQMINSGVAPAERRNGVYSELAHRVIEHATSLGFAAILSRHAANNNAVIIAKLKLGFFVSGFEYSAVYGPLVRLTLLAGERRRTLHHARSSPIRPLHPS